MHFYFRIFYLMHIYLSMFLLSCTFFPTLTRAHVTHVLEFTRA